MSNLPAEKQSESEKPDAEPATLAPSEAKPSDDQDLGKVLQQVIDSTPKGI